MSCERTDYAYTCTECWPHKPARWCDSCFERFGTAHPYSHVEAIVDILGRASQATVDPERATDIAQRAIAEACDNREGK